MESMNPFFILNWKSYVASTEDVQALCSALAMWREHVKGGTVIICPPATLIDDVQACVANDQRLSGVRIGAQYLDADGKTGGLSVAMLRAAGVSAAIIGHAERRAQSGETDADVRAAWQQAITHDILPIVCVGQDAPDPSYNGLRVQVGAAFGGAPATDVAQCIAVYEPVWAISSTPGSRMEQPDDITHAVEQVRIALGDTKPLAVLYGGSVTSATAASVFMSGSIDGILVGRASAFPDSLKELLEALTPFFS